jgi:hypothetical protein
LLQTPRIIGFGIRKGDKQMRSRIPFLFATVVFCSMAATSAFAGHHHGWSHGAGVPGPIAGAGLPFAIVAGAAYAFRRLKGR